VLIVSLQFKRKYHTFNWTHSAEIFYFEKATQFQNEIPKKIFICVNGFFKTWM